MRFPYVYRTTRSMSSVQKISPRHSLITILGATGTGKSELAVSLARRFNGEIINGDALQLYQGLPIVTNKITEAEQHGIKHHLLGTVPLTEPSWTVSQFTKKATDIIEDIRARGKLPILVGGTHYYLQSTLFKDALVEVDSGGSLESTIRNEGTRHQFLNVEEQEKKWPILAACPEAVRAELLRVDPVMAERWHPKDHRKIRRSLMIYLQTGRLASEVYAEQAQQRKTSTITNEADVVINRTAEDAAPASTLRYDNLLFWTYTKLESLDTRLSSRVDKMVDRGLINEVKMLNDFRISQEQLGKGIDDTRGIWVAIGYKEYASYLQAINDPDPQNGSENILEALAYSKERTFISTRQYARYQMKWIRRKLFPSLVEAGIRDRFFLLDSTDISNFTPEVEDKAASIAGKWLAGEPLPLPDSISDSAAEVLSSLDANEIGERSPQTCEDCCVTVMTDDEWAKHLRSTKHRRLIKRKLQDARNPERAKMIAEKKALAEEERHKKLASQMAEVESEADSTPEAKIGMNC